MKNASEKPRLRTNEEHLGYALDILARFCALLRDFPVPVKIGGRELSERERLLFEDFRGAPIDVALLFLNSKAWQPDFEPRGQLAVRAAQVMGYWHDKWEEIGEGLGDPDAAG